MAYADQEMSGNRIIALIIVALIHIAVGYVLVTGLAYQAVQEIAERVTAVDIDEPEPEPEPEEPPPPPEEVPETVPPPFVPPPQQNLNNDAQTMRSSEKIDDTQQEVQRTPNKTCPDGSVVAQTATCGPATKTCPDGKSYPVNATCPPVNRVEPKAATPRGNPGRWASNRDYPRRALREEREGTTRFRVTINADGRVTNCQITGSSGHPDLDETTCKLITRRARFNAATDGNGDKTAGSWSSAVRWNVDG